MVVCSAVGSAALGNRDCRDGVRKTWHRAVVGMAQPRAAAVRHGRVTSPLCECHICTCFTLGIPLQELLSMQIAVVLSSLLPLDERGAHRHSVTLRDRERPSLCHSKIEADNTDKP